MFASFFVCARVCESEKLIDFSKHIADLHNLPFPLSCECLAFLQLGHLDLVKTLQQKE